jgi:hypothetical protein
VKFRRLDVDRIRQFTEAIRPLFDEKDKHLIVAAANELFSDGRILAVLSKDAENTPGVFQKVTVGVRNIAQMPDGGIGIRSPSKPFYVIPSDEVPRGPWPKQLVLVQHSVGIALGMQFVTRRGTPVDIRSFETVVAAFGKTKSGRRRLAKRLKELGMKVRFRAATKVTVK